MSSFWTSGSGKPLSGKPEDSFVGDFTTIPEGTASEAMIKTFITVEKVNKYKDTTERYLEITWKIVSEQFKNREVSQKIKVFSGSPEQIDRNLNLLKLIMELCNYKPTHANAPTDAELAGMQGNVAAIKIGEWALPKNDGSGMMEGNFVREVWKSGSIALEIGVKAVVTSVSTHLDSAFSRNAMPELDSDLPF